MSLRKGLVIFLLCTFGVSAFVLLTSVDRRTLTLLFEADKRALLIALILVVMAWCCDALRFCAVARAASERISFRLGLIQIGRAHV